MRTSLRLTALRSIQSSQTEVAAGSEGPQTDFASYGEGALKVTTDALDSLPLRMVPPSLSLAYPQQKPAATECTAPGFLDTRGGCHGMAPATIVDPGATVRSGVVSDHGHAASAAARAAAGVRWPSRSMSHSAL